ncbi:MAG: TetR/AcrR family transcriptional regulator [Myxococcales bacterium]|nr:TetR/AcrR family transcriptional regulator [Myxococcales bacterium]
MRDELDPKAIPSDQTKTLHLGSRGLGVSWIRRPPQQERSADTLHRLLCASEDLLQTRRFEDITIMDIVERAQSSVGAFYARFRSKENLLFELQRRLYLDLVASLESAVNSEPWVSANLDEQIEATIRFGVSSYRERRGLFRAIIVGTYHVPEIRDRAVEYNKCVMDIVANAWLKSASIRHPEPEQAARICVLIAVSMLREWIIFGEVWSDTMTISDEQFGCEVVRACRRYLGG